MQRHRVGILGATGLVGQRLIERLADHPWFELVALAASERSIGRRYADVVAWQLPGDPPAAAGALELRPCLPGDLPDCTLVLSALDAAVARELEPQFAEAGFAVISNSSAHRRSPQVPLLVPEVNAAHVSLVEASRRRAGAGYIVTNPNCSVAGLAVALAPLERSFGLRRLVVTTLQAVSGAGLSGPRALDLVDNVVPFIADEEDKLERELNKIFGRLDGAAVREPAIAVSAHCHRVGVLDGHMAAVSVELDRPGDVADARRALASFVGDVAELGLPSAPARPIELRDEPDRPQPRRDRDAGGGMTVVVGRVRPCPVLGLKLEVLSHNTVRGAAGATILNAELLAARGLLPRERTR